MTYYISLLIKKCKLNIILQLYYIFKKNINAMINKNINSN